MKVLVWVDAWQMQCCGDSFAVGDEIEWALGVDTDVDWLAGALGADLANRIGYAEDHHGQLPEDAPTTRGTVLGIKTAHGHYAPSTQDARTLYPVPGSAVLTDVEHVDGSESDVRELRLNGYVVELAVAAAAI